MTAYNVVRLWCDHKDAPVAGAGVGHMCMRTVEVAAENFEAARQIAAHGGWTRVAASGADEGDRCPDHNPEPVQVHPVPEEG